MFYIVSLACLTNLYSNTEGVAQLAYNHGLNPEVDGLKLHDHIGAIGDPPGSPRLVGIILV